MLARDGKAHAQIVRQTASKAGEGTRSVRRGKRGAASVMNWAVAPARSRNATGTGVSARSEISSGFLTASV
jgi:hypothetical protein